MSNFRFDVNGKTIVISGKSREHALKSVNKSVRTAIQTSEIKSCLPWKSLKSVVINGAK